jgi:2-methylcitrate dehydratase PrpD
MATDYDGQPDRSVCVARLGRRDVLRGALLVGGMSTLSPLTAFAQPQTPTDGTRGESPNALALARLLNRTKFGDLPPKAVMHAKMSLASTLACAAAGSGAGSTKIIRDLAKENGGRPDATIWFDGTRIPVNEAAHVNATMSDAFASDDSDIRNTMHIGTNITSAGLAVGERTGASGQDLITAMVVGYEAAGRIFDARKGNRGGVHASQNVAFAGAVTAAKLLKLTDQQIADAIGLVAVTQGGLAMGTNSWAREYMGGNAAFCGVNAALAAGRGYTVSADMLESRGGYLTVYGGGKPESELLTRDYGKDWDIVKYLAIKLRPGSHPYSSMVEASINASREANVSASQIVKILVDRRNLLGEPNPPKDLVEAFHSLEYYLAAAAADKDFNWSHASPAKFQDPAITRLMRLVEYAPAPQPVKYQWGWGGTVTIVTTTGSRFTSTVDAPWGSAPRGIEWSDVDAKYHTLMPNAKLSAKRIEESLNMIHDFDLAKSVKDLTGMINVRS